ncbi:hypothetical protein DVH24_026711 [Malus domestica]|uniref:Secreted protein n=1 Tax=Malus domestica TaxID=3750 RepID=A0A498K3S6_MALDO|nr:hypothetical protein DVH24_026711 [Malus domestica]
MNRGHQFLFFLLPRLFTTCLSSFGGSNSKQKRKKTTSRSNNISSIGCLDKQVLIHGFKGYPLSLFCPPFLLQLMPIYRHHRRVLELVTWGERWRA